MLDLLIAILFGINNSRRAKAKGQNPTLWIFITVVATMFGEFIGNVVVLMFFNHNIVDVKAFLAGKETVSQFEQQYLTLFNDLSHAIFVLLCAFGGYLLIRYILERMPDKKDGNGNFIQNINDPE
jgi:hypothetical protein